MEQEYYKGMKVYSGGKYKCVTKDGKPNVMIHRLIWEAYYGIKIPPGYIVNHLDKDPNNNNITNLDLVSRSESQKHNTLGDKNCNFKYLYTMFDKDNNLVGHAEPLNYYMKNLDWNINSIATSPRIINGRITVKGGKYRGSLVIIHKQV